MSEIMCECGHDADDHEHESMGCRANVEIWRDSSSTLKLCDCFKNYGEVIAIAQRDEAARLFWRERKARLKAEAQCGKYKYTAMTVSQLVVERDELKAQLAAANETIIELRSQLHMLCDIGDNLTRALDAKDGEG